MDANAREPSNFEIGQESTQPAELVAPIGGDAPNSVAGLSRWS